MSLLKESVERDEHAHHGELVGVDEVERLRHRNEHLVVDALWDTLLHTSVTVRFRAQIHPLLCAYRVRAREQIMERYKYWLKWGSTLVTAKCVRFACDKLNPFQELSSNMALN